MSFPLDQDIPLFTGTGAVLRIRAGLPVAVFEPGPRICDTINEAIVSSNFDVETVDEEFAIAVKLAQQGEALLGELVDAASAAWGLRLERDGNADIDKHGTTIPVLAQRS